MADFFTHTVPDYGEEDTIMGRAGTSLTDRLRRIALAMSLQAKSFSQDPLRTIAPWTRVPGAVARQLPSYASNRLLGLKPGDPGYTDPPKSPEADLAGQYVGPKDMIAHQTIPGYIPRQNWANALKQDPLAGLLGPMQQPSLKQPEPTSGF